MNKIFLVIICTFTFSFYISPMETVTADNLQPISADYHYDAKKKILLELASNVHLYIPEKNNNNQISLDTAAKIIFSVSFVNQDLYKTLEDMRTNAITARSIITKITNKNPINFYHLATRHCLDDEQTIGYKWHGAIECSRLSNELYDEKLTQNQLEELFSKGAMLEYEHTNSYNDLLTYWALRSNDIADIKIFEKLLELGANHNNTLSAIISDNKIQQLKIILKYKPKIDQSDWKSVFYPNRLNLPNKKQYLKLLLEHATKEELNEGLITCFNHNKERHLIYYQPKLMKKFIKKEANIHVALNFLTNILPETTCPSFDEHAFNQNLIFLCNNGAFDQKALDNLKTTRDLFNTFINAIEKNQPS